MERVEMVRKNGCRGGDLVLFPESNTMLFAILSKDGWVTRGQQKSEAQPVKSGSRTQTSPREEQ